MTIHGRMRRQARRARRAGLQPVVLLDSDGGFRPSAGEVIARVAWRYRSESAPFLVAGAVSLAGWWAHLTTPHWYPFFIVGSAAATWLRLAHGQTIADVTARIPAIESALGTVHGAVQVFPAWDGKANWCEIRVLGSDTPRTTTRRCG